MKLANLIALVLALLISGCASRVEVRRGDCSARISGLMPSWTTPGAVEVCRPDEAPL